MTTRLADIEALLNAPGVDVASALQIAAERCAQVGIGLRVRLEVRFQDPDPQALPDGMTSEEFHERVWNRIAARILREGDHERDVLLDVSRGLRTGYFGVVLPPVSFAVANAGPMVMVQAQAVVIFDAAGSGRGVRWVLTGTFSPGQPWFPFFDRFAAGL